MAASAEDRAFAGSIPQLYERYLVPLIFEPYAVDLAGRVARHAPREVLEIAAGTGVVTRQLARVLPAVSRITATDLNAPMIQEAQARGTEVPVKWRAADATDLPFDDACFDAVACQFGVMFFPDKARAFAEARRVLRPGGRLFFNAWDAIGHNEFADVVTQALARLFPDDPPRFMARVPHGYADPGVVRRDLAAGGFAGDVQVEVVTASSRAASARDAAIAFCQGTPLRNEIEARRPGALAEATDRAEAALAGRFGHGLIEGRIQAIVYTTEPQP